jgi:uncharacterized protein (TIGR00297 family)
MTNFIQLFSAFIISVIVAALAYWRGSLSKSGAAGALIVGTLTLGFGGWSWAALLAVFFISSSLLSHFKEEEKKAAAEKFEKGHQRDLGQALANGGLGAILATLSAFLPVSVIPTNTWFFFYLGVMASVTADTWATELGTLSKQPPRLITTGRIVEIGTSGGVSLLGTAVSFLGGLAIGLTAGLVTNFSLPAMLITGALSGLTGSLVDSLLGATVQQIYFSEDRQKETEKKFERDGTANEPLRGWSWMNNDLVNLLASLVGGFIAVTSAWLFS